MAFISSLETQIITFIPQTIHDTWHSDTMYELAMLKLFHSPPKKIRESFFIK